MKDARWGLDRWEIRAETLRQRLFRVMLLALCAGVTACAGVPDGARIIEQKSATASPAIITGVHGPLSAQRSAEVLKKEGASDALLSHLALEEAVAEIPLTSGNSTRVLVDGKDTFRAMFALIASAKRSINLEYFIFEDVKSDGINLGNLLIKKRRQGVAVNVMYDAFGSGSTPPEFIDRLKKNRIKVVQFNPINPLQAKKRYAPNDRDHRKILVVDGLTAITGGVNLSTTYQTSGSGRSGNPSDTVDTYWHDTDIEIRGPAVAQLQKLFLDHWSKQKGPSLGKLNYFPPQASNGDELIRVIGSTADKTIPHYYVTLLSAIRSAQKRIWLTAAYFVPTDEQMYALTAAARRGVDVRLVVPDKSDSMLSTLMQHSHYEDLLESGVHIYETHNEVLHSKTVIVDGLWTVIGSSNFDHRSVVFNDEVDVVIVGRKTGAELERLFQQDCAKARQVTRERWNHRAPLKRLEETVAPLWLMTVKSNL
jgi:cardiolipin synthase A/B